MRIVMRFKGLVATIIFGIAAATASASPEVPKEGVEYIALKSPQPAQAVGKKVEVIEFFMYHCPACNAIDAELNAWVKKNADTVHFRRIHLPLKPQNDPEAHLFLTLESMKLADQMHEKVLRTWHVERQRLTSDEDNIAWAVKNGIDKAQFLSHYESFSVQTKLRGLGRLTSGYGVDNTPTIVIDGRYLTSPSMVYGANKAIPQNMALQATFKVIDKLVADAAKGKN
jgi:protein dithiol oxidoreductase (disulfide-forming)